MAVSMATTLRNARADAITTALGTSALLRIYTAAYATLLVELVCNGSAFAAGASGGVLTLNSVSAGTAVASGTAAIARLLTSGATMKLEGITVTDSSGAGPLKLDQTGTTISSGQSVTLTSGTVTEGNA
jgi:hypothetical protein